MNILSRWHLKYTQGQTIMGLKGSWLQICMHMLTTSGSVGIRDCAMYVALYYSVCVTVVHVCKHALCVHIHYTTHTFAASPWVQSPNNWTHLTFHNTQIPQTASASVDHLPNEKNYCEILLYMYAGAELLMYMVCVIFRRPNGREYYYRVLQLPSQNFDTTIMQELFVFDLLLSCGGVCMQYFFFAC